MYCLGSLIFSFSVSIVPKDWLQFFFGFNIISVVPYNKFTRLFVWFIGLSAVDVIVIVLRYHKKEMWVITVTLWLGSKEIHLRNILKQV